MSTTTVLFVEDDLRASTLLAQFLCRGGYDVVVATTLTDAEAAYARARPAAILLDLVLPDGNGLTLLARIRATDANLPVVVISALGSEAHQITSFEMGASDFVAKPASPHLIEARLRAQVRRCEANMATLHALDSDGRLLCNGTTTVRLSRTEAAVLRKLSCRPRTVLTRRDLLESWPTTSRPKQRSVDLCIFNLRRKLDPLGHGDCIRTERGGYSCHAHLRLPQRAGDAGKRPALAEVRRPRADRR